MPIKLSIIKLTTSCKEKATGLKGMVTHAIVLTDHRVKYLFQPHGLNPEDGKPVEKIFVGDERLEIPSNCMHDVSVPVEILGTQVTDRASGFSGTAIEFVLHTHGCFHVIIQPQGRLKKTNCAIGRCEFDLRQCEGPMIKKLDEKELAESKKKKPSPSGSTYNAGLPNITSDLTRISNY